MTEHQTSNCDSRTTMRLYSIILVLLVCCGCQTATTPLTGRSFEERCNVAIPTATEGDRIASWHRVPIWVVTTNETMGVMSDELRYVASNEVVSILTTIRREQDLPGLIIIADRDTPFSAVRQLAKLMMTVGFSCVSFGAMRQRGNGFEPTGFSVVFDVSTHCATNQMRLELTRQYLRAGTQEITITNSDKTKLNQFIERTTNVRLEVDNNVKYCEVISVLNELKKIPKVDGVFVTL